MTGLESNLGLLLCMPRVVTTLLPWHLPIGEISGKFEISHSKNRTCAVWQNPRILINNATLPLLTVLKDGQSEGTVKVVSVSVFLSTWKKYQGEKMKSC